MNLTFEGFLKSYCRELSGQKSLSYRRLFALAETEASRLVEPLFALSLAQGKAEYLVRLSSETKLAGRFTDLLEQARLHDSLEGFFASDDTDPRMKNVWAAYQAKKHPVDASRRIVSLMRPAILEGLEKKSVTVYRMCKDLNLNLGNAYAYLSAGDSTKVSRMAANRMLEYATS